MAYAGHIYLLHGLAHPVIEDAPYPRGCLVDSTGDTVHGHLTLYEKHGVGFKKQREATVLACPWHICHDRLVLAGLDTGNAGMKVTQMLEEVQVTPCLVDGVMGCALLVSNPKG